MTLLKNVSEQLNRWLSEDKRFPINTWVSGKEGSIYLRFVPAWQQIDLASFEINARYRGKGVARSIIHEAIRKNVKCVRIESISKDGWFEKVSKYTFDGYKTEIKDQGGYGLVFDILFKKC